MSITPAAGAAPPLDTAPAYQRGAGFLLARLGAIAENNWKAFIADVGLTQAEFAILSVLADGTSVRQRDAAVRAIIDPRNAVPVVASLTRRELVVAESDARDGRAKLLRISTNGARLLGQVTARLLGERSGFFSALSPAEYDLLCGLLDRVYRSHLGPA